MNDDQIEKRIRELKKSGKTIKLQVPTEIRDGGGALGECKTSTHKCAACEDDKPQFEFGLGDSKFCLHKRCYDLWTQIDSKPN